MIEMAKAFLTSESQHWGTPPALLKALSFEFNFTLDVAATSETAKAAKFYTEEDNAFAQDWVSDAGGGDVWCNPPYGDKRYPVSKWVRKAFDLRQVLTTVLLLPANKTDQDWFHDLVCKYGQYRPVRGRIGFTMGGKVCTGNSQGSMLVVFGREYPPCPPVTFNWKGIKRNEKP